MRSFLTCLFPRLACLLAVSCAPGSQRAALAPKGVRVDTVLVFTADPFSTKHFPQIPDSSRLLPDRSIRPDSTAGPCDPRSEISTQRWPRTQVPLYAVAGSLSIRLPSEFTSMFLEPVHVMTWSGRTKPQAISDHISLSLGHRQQGYPTISAEGNAQQTQLRECQLSLAAGQDITVMLFTIAWSGPPARVEYYLLASSNLNATLPIQVVGFAGDSIVQAQFLAALRTIEVSRK